MKKEDIIKTLYEDAFTNLKADKKERTIFNQIAKIEESLVAVHGESVKEVLRKLENLYLTHSDFNSETMFAIGFDYGLSLKG